MNLSTECAAGWQAREAGVLAKDCPHYWSSPAADAWQAGWWAHANKLVCPVSARTMRGGIKLLYPVELSLRVTNDKSGTTVTLRSS